MQIITMRHVSASTLVENVSELQFVSRLEESSLKAPDYTTEQHAQL